MQQSTPDIKESKREPAQVGRSIRKITQDLNRPIPPRLLKQRDGKGGGKLTYIPWHTAVRYLDEYAPGWSYEIRSVQTGPAVVQEKVRDPNDSRKKIAVDRHITTLVMTVRISIPTAEGLIYREASAFEIIGENGFGDAATNAESAALRRAAAKFNLALYLYETQR